MFLVIFLPHIVGFISVLIFTLVLFYMIIRALANLFRQWKNIKNLKHYNIFDDTLDLSAKSIIIKQFLSICSHNTPYFPPMFRCSVICQILHTRDK